MIFRKEQKTRQGAMLMYIRLIYYPGERSLVEKTEKDASLAIVADKMFFLDAVDNDGDALRFQHNNGSHFDVIFLQNECAQQVYSQILDGVREKQVLLEMDIRALQITVKQ